MARIYHSRVQHARPPPLLAEPICTAAATAVYSCLTIIRAVYATTRVQKCHLACAHAGNGSTCRLARRIAAPCCLPRVSLERWAVDAPLQAAASSRCSCSRHKGAMVLTPAAHRSAPPPPRPWPFAAGCGPACWRKRPTKGDDNSRPSWLVLGRQQHAFVGTPVPWQADGPLRGAGDAAVTLPRAMLLSCGVHRSVVYALPLNASCVLLCIASPAAARCRGSPPPPFHWPPAQAATAKENWTSNRNGCVGLFARGDSQKRRGNVRALQQSAFYSNLLHNKQASPAARQL